MTPGAFTSSFTNLNFCSKDQAVKNVKSETFLQVSWLKEISLVQSHAATSLLKLQLVTVLFFLEYAFFKENYPVKFSIKMQFHLPHGSHWSFLTAWSNGTFQTQTGKKSPEKAEMKANENCFFCLWKAEIFPSFLQDWFSRLIGLLCTDDLQELALYLCKVQFIKSFLNPTVL